MSLDAAANALDAGVDGLRKQTQAMADAPMRAGDSKGWVGASQLGCEARAGSDRVEINKLGADLTHAANVLRNTSSAIGPNRTTALLRALGLERDKFSVADDWTVRDTRDYAAELKGVEAGSATESAILADQASRSEEAKTATLSLQSLADQMGEDDRNGARVLATAFGDAEGNAPLASSYSPGQASIDVQAIMSGTATREQKDRFFSATSLTPEQRAALARGDFAVIPKEQFDYLKAIYTPNWGGGPEGHPLSLGALVSFGDKHTGAERETLKQSLADGVYMLGNRNLRTGQTDSNVFAEIWGTQAPFVTGGMSQLPAPIRDALTESAASKGRLTVPDSGAHSGGHRSVTDLKTFDDLKSVMDILEHRSVDPAGGVYGSESVQLGSDVDRALIARASEIAGAGATEYASNPGLLDHNLVGKGEVESLLVHMLGVAGSDHIAVHDAVMSATGNPSSSTMPTTFDMDGTERSFKDAEALKHLLTFDWTDEAGHESDGINKLFNWMPGAAYAPDGSSPEAILESQRAGNISTALTQYFGDNKDALIDIGDRKPALGELNPELTRTLASAIGSHTAVLAGADPQLFHTHGVSEVDASDLKSTFEILNSDAAAGRIVNSLTALQIDVMQQEFGKNPHDYGLGEVTGRLEGAMIGGLDAHIEETKIDGRHLAAHDAAVAGAMFDSAKALLTAVPGLDPAVKLLVDAAAPQVKLNLSGLPTDPDMIKADPEIQQLRNDMFDDDVNPNAKYVQILAGYFETHPELADDPDFRDLFLGDSSADFAEMKRSGVMSNVTDESEAASFIQRKMRVDISLFADRHNENLEDAYKR
ncbi:MULTISPECIES: TPR repeat region-containing protein [Gordonia]|uniref:TPR repeat region-containing protein n=1 Tax=Gordonia sp. ABKF26 TaxID=3238687 RepID=UPI0034E3E2B9